MDRTPAQAQRALISAHPSRRRLSTLRVWGWTALVLLLIGVRPAHAYLDPGSGSMLLQIVLGGVAGVAVLGRLAWQRVASVFRPGKPESSPPPPGGNRSENGAN